MAEKRWVLVAMAWCQAALFLSGWRGTVRLAQELARYRPVSRETALAWAMAARAVMVGLAVALGLAGLASFMAHGVLDW